ncbi:hypothetical protein FOA52_008952 [Chlamydomonas sp. UWO 241]|nr:hypothetical protein FOA52_008952 [Chlamydomonas sp. UWO 241]
MARRKRATPHASPSHGGPSPSLSGDDSVQGTCGPRRSSRLAGVRDDAVSTPWHDSAVFVDKPSVALKPGLLGAAASRPCDPDSLDGGPPDAGGLSGLWGVLPEELVDGILKSCSPAQLGMLQSTCTYFRHSKLIEKIAKHKLKAVPRARGLKPRKRENETSLALLNFVNCQSAAAAQATAVACGGYHTSALLIQRETCGSSRHGLYTFGRNFHGQLGIPGFEDQRSPTPISLGFRPCQDNVDAEEETMPAVVAFGSHHSTCISRRGELFSWGISKSGELGQGRAAPIEVPSPRQCPLPHVRIVSVACGTSHTLAIGESGSLWTCGKNNCGQLGLGNLGDSSRLQMVQNLPGARVVSAAAGAAHSVALASDGSLFTWGDGSHGQLGHYQLHSMALANADAQNSITLLLPQKIVRLDPCALSPENRVTAISAGYYHSMALTVGGSILAFGGNSSGCLGVGDEEDRWKPTRVNLAMPDENNVCVRAVQLACGAGHTVALISRQGCMEVRTTGANNWGQLGVSGRTSVSRFTPTLLIKKVTAVQAGDEHSAAVTEDGSLFLWGRGDSGQLGMGDNRSRSRPTLLKNFVVVHPDKTLRRSKRNHPFVRPVPDAKRQRITDHMLQ